MKSIVVLICICIFCAGLTCTQSIAEQVIFQPYTNPLPVPEFSLENLQGKTVDIRDYRGQVLLLNFCCHLVTDLPEGGSFFRKTIHSVSLQRACDVSRHSG